MVVPTPPTKPSRLISKANFAAIGERDPNSAAFKAYLIKQGYKESDLPFKTWGVRELTLCALFYHSNLNVAKAQLGLAQTALNIAGVKQAPTIGGHISHSNQKNGDINPWAFGLQVEIPIETTQKRALTIEQAQHLAEAAQLDVAETAWQLREAIAADLLQLNENTATIAQLKEELATQQKILSLLQKRVEKGLASNTDLHPYQLAAQQLQFTLTNAQAKTDEIRATLAADCGLSLEKVNQVTLQPFNLDDVLSQQNAVLKEAMTTKVLQEKTLLNRIDIRRGLAKYAAAESKIKLEIAKQKPDISLSPSLAYEFGDTIWSLGINTLLNFANQNQTMIAEAQQLREVEAAQFEALQAQTLADLAIAQAQYQAANNTLAAQTQLLNTQNQQLQKQQNQLDAGLIDRLALTQSSLSQLQAKQQLQTAKFALLQAALKLENIMQTPIEGVSTLPSELKK